MQEFDEGKYCLPDRNKQGETSHVKDISGFTKTLLISRVREEKKVYLRNVDPYQGYKDPDPDTDPPFPKY